MNVVNSLAGVGALIEHQAIAGLGDASVPGDFMGSGEEAAEQLFVVELGNPFNVAPGQDQEVDRRLWIDVGDRDHVVVPVDRPQLWIRDQPAEDAFSQGLLYSFSPATGPP